jgi:hypothetical protein
MAAIDGAAGSENDLDGERNVDDCLDRVVDRGRDISFDALRVPQQKEVVPD